jgi:hypothetical protein
MFHHTDLRSTRSLLVPSGASRLRFLFAVAPLQRKKSKPTCIPNASNLHSRCGEPSGLNLTSVFNDIDSNSLT